MKHFLHSGCLLRSVFEVELKMSSFLYQSSVLGVGGGTGGQAGRGREKKFVIQMEEARGRLKKKNGGGSRQTRSKRCFFFFFSCSAAIIRDRILQVDSSARFHISVA